MNQNLFKPTYLKQLCLDYGLSPSKKYGQNYLISDAPIRKMLVSADVKAGDSVVEIGPGFGVLTFALADAGANVIAFEIERKLQQYWDEHKLSNVEMVWGNVLNKIQDTSKKIQEFKVVANLPYQITSQVLRTVLELEHPPTSMTVMVQKEVAERMCAKPSARDMSVLAVSVQYYGVPHMVAKVMRGNFWPVPGVDSAIVHIDCHTERASREEQAYFFDVVKAGFANKRKQLWKNLSIKLHIDGDVVKQMVRDVMGNEKVRAQELGVEEWREMVRQLKKT